MQAELFHQIGSVFLDRLDADSQKNGDPLVGRTFRDKLENLPLSVRETLPRRGGDRVVRAMQIR